MSSSTDSPVAGTSSSPPAGPIRVLLVDDDPLTRSAIRQFLRPPDRFTVVGECADGEQAVEAVEGLPVDVVLMDLGMPVMDGVEATRRICAAPTAPQVVVLTTWDVDDAVVRAIEAGASGYLLKVEAPGQLAAALTRVVTGEPVLSPGAMRQLLEHVRTQQTGPDGPWPPTDEATPSTGLMPQTGPTSGPTAGVELTPREREAVAGAAEGLSNEEIGARLYVSASTVKTLLSSAQGRLGARNRTQVAVLAVRGGLI
ncbi:MULTISPECIES: response regulator [Actinomyces]|uniref:response regulator n=1 Tax=Actinomyces TaxID=1654 RepID=UPI001F242210|nr:MULTISPECIES: response regulator transcription factor [Actinomyces]